jgi:two-component system, cell cycle sensor histidine kinase and response regulator CckA
LNSKEAGSILVMDDEQLVRDIASSMLRHLGYDVTTCTKGEEALQLYKGAMESGKPFMAVIMDLVIQGGMGGVEAARVIRRYDPQAWLIASSGYSTESVMANPQRFGFNICMPKPYTLKQMAETMAQVPHL